MRVPSCTINLVRAAGFFPVRSLGCWKLALASGAALRQLILRHGRDSRSARDADLDRLEPEPQRELDYSLERRLAQSAAERGVVQEGGLIGGRNDVWGVGLCRRVQSEHPTRADSIGRVVEDVGGLRGELQVAPLAPDGSLLRDGHVPVVDMSHYVVATPAIAHAAPARPDPLGIIHQRNVADDLRGGGATVG